MLLSYTIVDFHLFYDGAVDIQIRAPPTRSQCKVCDTRVTVKASDHKYFDTSRKILSQEMTICNMEALVSYL